MKKVLLGGIPLLLLCINLTIASFGQKKDSTKTDSTRIIKTSLSVTDQHKKYLPNYSPLSPNAAGMQQLFDYQVNLATGNPDISILLYTINDGGITQPVTLRYQATGHRLKSLAAWTGWGWTLDYGSGVNRSLQGRPDDAPISANYLTTPILTSDAPNLCSNLTNFTFAKRIRDNQGDAQPDIFSYAIGGKSGKFTLGQGTNAPYLIPFQPIKINKTLNSFGRINAFEIIDDDGKAYHFGVDSLGNAATESQNATSGQSTDNYISTWQLTKINSPNTNDHLNFYYQDGGSLTQDDKQWSVSIISDAAGTINGQPYYNNTGSATATATNVSTTTSQSNIHKITFTNGELEFIQNGSGETRNDQPNSKYLKQINIYNYENGIKKLQKVIEFSYSYFKDVTNADGRLKLDKVRFRDTTNTIQLDHTFEYHSNTYSWADNETYQPQQDFFGFFNGYPNQSLIGLSSYNVGSTLNPNIISITNGGANRSTVATYMKQGVLKKITYPTGGFTTFDYETNQYQYEGTTYLAGGLRVKEIKSYPSTTVTPITKRYVYGTATDSVGIGYFATNWFPQSAIVPIQQSLRYATNAPAGGTASATQRIFNPNGQLDVGSFDVSPVYYTWVKEYFEDDTATIKNGRNEYSFGFRRDIIASEPQYHIRDIKTWLRGQLLEKRTYDKFNVLKSKVTNAYTEYKTDLKTVAGWVNTTNIYEGDGWPPECSTDLVTSQGGSPDIIYNSYEYPTGHLKLTSTTTLLDSVSTDAVYTYNDNLLVTKTETSDSYTNHKHIQESVYTTDATYDLDNEVLEMRNRNMVGIALESIEKEDLNGMVNTLYKQKTVYERFTGNNARGLSNNPQAKEIWVAPTGGTLEKRVVFSAYDTNGNPTEYKADNIPTTLIWGYKGALLLAQIQNATISQVNTALATAGVTAGAYSLTNLSNAQLTALSVFRNALPNSLVSWYTYRPNIGMSSSIAPNGLRSRFFYDVFGRLSLTQDHDNNKLSEYEYLYGSINRITTKQYRFTIIGILSVNNEPTFTTTHTYFDGLGRPIQTVGEALSPQAKDIVLSTQTYDKYGRSETGVTIFPTANDNGGYVNNGLSLAQSFYKDNAPFTRAEYESSPLNRPRYQLGLGNAWHTTNKKTQLFDESAGATVPYYTIDATGNITKNGFYPNKSLFKKRVIDEQGNTTIEITDKRGRLIQRQQVNGNDLLTTYYINDGLGRVLAILQPNAYALNSSISQGSTDWLNGVFFYKYDNRGRATEKHIPNGGFTYMVYDNADREVLSQDAHQRTLNVWTYKKYDGLSREVLNGELNNSSSRSTLQSQFDAHTTLSETFDSSKPEQLYYTNSSFPFSVDSSKAIQVNYYDNYNTWRKTAFEPTQSSYSNTKGLLTGMQQRYTENKTWLTETFYYDTKNRVTESRKQDIIGNVESLKTVYRFLGGMYSHTHLYAPQYFGSGGVYVSKAYAFDRGERKTKITTFFSPIIMKDTSFSVITDYAYNEIGQLITKKFQPNRQYKIANAGQDYINRPPALTENNTQDIANKAVIISPPFVADSTHLTYLAEIDTTHSNGLVDAMQTVNYGYHIRGQMNCINCRNNQVKPNTKENDFFSMKLGFEDDKRYFDGNISYQTWKTPFIAKNQQYKHSYDGVSRLTKSLYSGGVSGSNYSLDSMAYDRNGNIQLLKRHTIDNLSYAYNGNQLLSVSDAGTTAGFNDGNTTGSDYGYWANGSLKFDKNKGIDSIVYNSYLKKVSRVKFSSGDWINFYYNGSGTLLKRKLSNGTVWMYRDDLLMKNDSVYQITHDEGRVTFDKINKKWLTEFDYRDIWGNLRVSFRDSLATPVNGVYAPPVVVQVEDRDPTGVSLAGINNSGINKNRFKFQGKEKLDWIGWIDFGARMYDPKIGGRFLSIDPRASEMPSWSPYSAFFGNPLRYIDPDGEAPKDIIPILARNGATGVNGHYAGHIGVLIGSDKNGWTFVSKEGRDKSTNAPWYSNELTGGPALPPKVISFKTKADFDNYKSEHMSEYTEETRFKTTEEQDKKATKAAIESGKTWYNAFCNNCADTVSDALEAAGLDGGTSTPSTPVPNAPASKSLIPNVRYDNMKKNNANLIVPEPPKPEPPKQKVVPNQSN